MKMTGKIYKKSFVRPAHAKSGRSVARARTLDLERPSTFRAMFMLPLMIGLLLIWRATAFADITGSAPPEIPAPPGSEVILIDAGVEDADRLASRVEPGAEVFILRADRPVVSQITEILSGRTGLTALHLFSHGSAGSLNFARGTLSDENLHRHRGELKLWGSALGPGGDILLYGCNVAEGEAGTAFVKDLAELTGADVAASIDATGHETFGADLDLEFVAGKMETDAAVSSDVVFGPLQTFDFDWASEGWSPSGPGSMPRTYTNIAGSGVDATVDVVENSYSGGSGFFISGTPNVNDDNGNLADEALNFKVNFPHRRDAVDITFTFSSPIYIYNGLTIRDIDRITNSYPYNYQDRILVWGTSGGSQVYPSHITLESPTNLAIGGGNGNRVHSVAGSNLNPGDPLGHATFYFHTQAISTLTIRYRGGNGGGSQNPGDQYIWIGDITGISTTQAVVSSFGAFAEAGRTVVEWETASEVGTLGFYLERLNEAVGEYEPRNDRLLPGLLHAPQGGVYRFVDEDAWPGETYTYRLIEVENSGRKLLHGPYTVLVREEDPWSSRRSRSARSAKDDDPPDYSRLPHQAPPAEQARIEERKNTVQTTRTRARAASGANVVKIAVVENGLYYLTDAQIADAMGADVESVRHWIKKKKLHLRNQGRHVSWFAGDGNAGLGFYGEAIESIFTRENVYWLHQARGRTMGMTRGRGPTPASGGGTFTETGRAEEDNWALPAIFDDPGDDYWLWEYVVSGNPSMGTRTFSLPIDGVDASADGGVTVNLKGQSDTDHHVTISLNGVEIEGWWSGATAHAVELRGPIFQEGENVVTVTGLLDTGAAYSVFYVDSFDFTYRRYYRAVDNKLFARGDGARVVTISGFTDPDIHLFELSDPGRPKRVRAVTLDEDDGEHRISFKPKNAQTLYLALTMDAFSAPLSLTVDSPSNLKQRKSGLDYVIITPLELKAAAQSLADYRMGDGLGVMVVELEDIYDEFNDGIASPLAIREFLLYVWKKWGGVTHVVLAGEGTYDYKNNLGAGDNLVPVLMASTPHGLFASDNLFADVIGDDGIPEMAIGRLPAATPAELYDLVGKIIDYESAPGGDWSARVMMLADDPDAAGDFPADSDDVAAILPDGSYTLQKIYLPDYAGVAAAQSDVVAGINEGAFLVNFIGHGGMDRLAQEGMLLTSDAASLSNGERLPVVIAMTCVMGRFATPGFDSLAEALLLNDGGGAAAVWAPAGLSVNAMAKILDEEFFRAVFQDGEEILGNAILKALKAYLIRGGASDTLYIYNLLGDPFMRMKWEHTNSSNVPGGGGATGSGGGPPPSPG